MFDEKINSFAPIFFINSQNAGLRPAMLAIAVSVRHGFQSFCDKLVLSRFHGRYFCRYIYTDSQLCQNVCLKRNIYYVKSRNLSVSIQYNSNIKTSGFYPESGFFRIFFNVQQRNFMLIPENQTLKKSDENCRRR